MSTPLTQVLIAGASHKERLTATPGSVPGCTHDGPGQPQDVRRIAGEDNLAWALPAADRAGWPKPLADRAGPLCFVAGGPDRPATRAPRAVTRARRETSCHPPKRMTGWLSRTTTRTPASLSGSHQIINVGGGPIRATSAVASIVGQPERLTCPSRKNYGTPMMSLARRCWGVMAATWLGVNVGGWKSLGLT